MGSSFIASLSFQAGYNIGVVILGATLLGLAGGIAGTFLFLRKRALVSDALAHATLPGIALAFMAATLLGADGRSLPLLLIGAAFSALLGVLAVGAVARYTRLGEDAAIASVLAVFFGIGIVLLTVVQSLGTGSAAGLETFLLGSAAGMIAADAWLIATGAALVLLLVFLLRRPMTMVAFDPGQASAQGYPVGLIDLATMGVVLAVTVIGLHLVGAVLILALLIIPPVSARFWTDRVGALLALSGSFGAASGYVGAALSAAAPALPTGPVIVLVCTALFAVSLLFAPNRGVLAAMLRHRRFQWQVHRRQGLLALARQELIHDRFTLTVLQRSGFIRADGVPTARGRAEAAKASRDEKRWEIARRLHSEGAYSIDYDGLSPIESVLTADQIADIDRRIGGPAPA